MLECANRTLTFCCTGCSCAIETNLYFVTDIWKVQRASHGRCLRTRKRFPYKDGCQLVLTINYYSVFQQALISTQQSLDDPKEANKHLTKSNSSVRLSTIRINCMSLFPA